MDPKPGQSRSDAASRIASFCESAAVGGFSVDFEPFRTPSSSRDRVAGRTEHNKLGLFTGWEDASLTKEGIAEAKRAGQLLRAHGFAVDAVYTSWLSRAIETAWLALQELDALWVPIIKSWRLNERMYGALTGLSKKAILGEHGEARRLH